MKDKFDLFERYSDDVVGEYICSFVSIKNLGMYNRFFNYLTGDAVVDEIKEKLVEIYGQDNVYKFSSERFIIMSRISRSKLTDFDYREKQMQKIGEELLEIEPLLSVNKTQIESKKVKLRVGIASDDSLQQVQNIFFLVKLAEECNRIAVRRQQTYFYTNEAFITSELEKDLVRDTVEDALDNNEFIPYYQPLISTTDNKVIGVEVLARWQKDVNDIVEPISFIEIAEEKEIIHAIDLNIIEQTFQTINIWNEDEILDLSFMINLNISLNSLEVINFKHIQDLARKYHINPSNVCFELHSDVFNDKNLAGKLEHIKRNGFKVAIDNIGTKDISLNAVTHAGVVDFIKIDKDVLPGGTVDVTHERIYRTLVDYAKLVDADMIACGVETLKQLDFCSYCGVEKMQGYYFSKVLGESEMRFYLEKHKNGLE